MTHSTVLTTDSVPLLPMRHLVVFPGQTASIVVGRARSRRALEAALVTPSRLILLVAQTRQVSAAEPAVADLSSVGVLARIDQADAGRDGTDHVYSTRVTGLARVRVIHDDASHENTPGYLTAHVENMDDHVDVTGDTLASLLDNLRTLGLELIDLIPGAERLDAELASTADPAALAYVLIRHLPFEPTLKHALLDTVSLRTRLLTLLERMVTLREELRLRRDVNEKLSSRLSRQHRDAILREQIRTLQEELGERPAGASGEDLGERIDAAKLPPDVYDVAREQLRRMEAIGPQSPEHHVIRSYLDLVLQLPWNDSSGGPIDLAAARRTLDEDHFGLEKIKTRIVQHLAVTKLRGKTGGILLFVGPPGVGKTSLGRSVARAMNREFVRVSLGGVRDDAEIRGHRRTYVGALPGRIVDGIKRAKRNDPVFMLDEIDKLGRGYGGDPAASLLEVLDPEQNAKFVDHYLDVPFDLSNVFFVATANSVDTIPAPLLDRMEVITLSGYTTDEKLHIARTHLVPKQLGDFGIGADRFGLTDAALLRLITGHTREAGVRELQRLIGQIVRASSERILAGGERIVVDAPDVERLIGPESHLAESIAVANPPGVATGLAWTPVGGDILYIESGRMPGTGKLILTGQLGEVMRESAQIALSLVRSKLQADTFIFDREDVHLHVPAGAIPKDGPSAGVAMLATLASLVLGRKIPSDLAMTGEITLRGAVTPVGGIKEKVIAAHRAGVRTVLLPKRNERDLRDVPESVRRDLEFVFAESVEDVLRVTLGVTPGQWTARLAPSRQEPTAS